MNMNIKFALENETKGALRYAEVLPDGTLAQFPNTLGAKIGTLYIRKTAFGSPLGSTNYPKRITVTITTTEEASA